MLSDAQWELIAPMLPAPQQAGRAGHSPMPARWAKPSSTGTGASIPWRVRVARPAGRPRARPEAARGEKAYSSRAIGTHLRARGIKAVIPEASD